MYISITGLKPKSLRAYVRFWILAIPAFRQSQTAKGNLYHAVKRVKGHQCTLTAWENRDKMLEFMRSGAHLKAMKAFPSIATGKIYGFEGEQIPTWDVAFNLLMEKGRVY